MTGILTLRTYSNEIYFIWLVAIQDRLLLKIHLWSLFARGYEFLTVDNTGATAEQVHLHILDWYSSLKRVFGNQKNDKTLKIQHCAP